MALITFNYKVFDSAEDLRAFVTTDTAITTVIAIVLEVSGRFTLFYSTAV